MKAKSAVCACALLLVARIAGAAVPGATAKKYAAVVLDSDTGVVLYESNADFSRYPASLTKMMTLYLTFDALKAGRTKLTNKLTVSEHAATRDPSRLGLSAGSTITLEDAIESMTTKSANDAACAVAESLANGSEARFAEMMTAKAQALGMKHTTFRNASGLPECGHLSSAMDIAILARALIRDFPEYYHFFSISHFEFRGKHYPTQNRFLRTYAGADGIKTGYIDSSGHNLAASAVRGGKRLISVVLGGDTARWTREYASQLMDVAYAEIDPKLLVVSKPAEPASATAAPASSGTSPATPAPEPTVVVSATAPAAAAVAAATTAPTAVAPASPALPANTATPQAGTAPAAAPTTPAMTATAIATNNAPAPVPSATRSSGTDALLASAQAPRQAPSKPSTVKSEAELKAKAWSVQVGLYDDREAARKRGEEARGCAPNHLAKAPMMLAGYGQGVSPRFGGLTEADARQACTQLQRKKLPCVVVPPGRAMVIATN